ncbi:hypothetical protein ACQPZA_24120 [Pseudonocardia xinjiangensis]|uniref:hypothetical protein n=1 Tax=Pseudonocardia xinjiangensis TaxID=75289 RepID=UPI003D8EF65B
MTLAVAGALLGAFAYRVAVSREGIVATARPVPFGEVIELSDLREVLLPPDTGLVTIPWTDVNTLVGLHAATDLFTNQTLTRDALTAKLSPAPGEAVVGLSVEVGHAPSVALQVRDQVLVITGGASPPRRASVVSAGDADVSGKRSIDVLVPQADSEELALASLDGRIAVVLVGRG